MTKRAYLTSRSLWAFSRYEVVRALWKLVAVPGLAFGNAVLCMSAATRRALEVRQREAGRVALGVHAYTTNEAVQGDMGWSSFEAREATAKLAFERRLSAMPDGRWAREVYKYGHLCCTNTKWMTRTGKLAQRYDVPQVRLTEALKPNWRLKVRDRVRETENAKWRGDAQARPSLRVYCEGKDCISREEIYDNSRGSGLLGEARSGVLRTRVMRAKFSLDLDTLGAQGARTRRKLSFT